ncbi:MAG: hypothetical protein OER22_09025, partial [Gammaproteobacteria bacterium]|nr:hypothetical protein [Gammaproteobacteria bacterium]
EAFDVKEGGIDQFMKDVKDNMEREADAKVKSELREQIMNALLEANRFDIPQTLKRQEMHTLQHDAMRRLGVEDHSQAPPIENFAEMAERRVRLSLLVTQLIADQRLTVDASKVRERIEEMCAGYENSDEMVDMYVNNAEIVRQIEPLVLEQQAFDWILENGKTTTKKVAFTEYMR